MSGSVNSEEPLFQEGYAEGYEAGYVIALSDARKAVMRLRFDVVKEPAVSAPAEAETVSDPLTVSPEQPVEDVIRVAPEQVEHPDPATDLQKQRNRERAERVGRSGRYFSKLALTVPPVDNPVDVMLVSEDADGWWFFLEDSYPVPEWRADIRWFAKEGARFDEDTTIVADSGEAEAEGEDG